MPSSTTTSVRPPDLSMSSTSPLIGTTVTRSGASMWYHTHKLDLFCATTTSELGTHCTYDEKESSVVRVALAMSYRCSALTIARWANLYVIKGWAKRGMKTADNGRPLPQSQEIT